MTAWCMLRTVTQIAFTSRRRTESSSKSSSLRRLPEWVGPPEASHSPRIKRSGSCSYPISRITRSGSLIGQMGQMGENGGLWFGLHMIAVDSQGNVYTGEVFAGERVQRFVPADSPRGKLLDQLSRLQ